MVLIPLLRIPSLQGQLFGPEESYLMVLAERMANGNLLYEDAWHAGPPILVWGYYIFYLIFGSYGQLVLNILGCIYIWICALYFNGIVAQFKPFQRLAGLPAILFAVLTSIPWYGQEWSSSLAQVLPFLAAFQAILSLGDYKVKNFQLMFRIGFLMGLILFLGYKGIILNLALLFAYFIVRSAKFDELFSLIGGLIIVSVIVVMILFIQGTLDDFWDIGILYYFDRFRLTDKGLYSFQPFSNLQSWLYATGVMAFLAMIGFLHFRLRFFSYVAKIRTLEVVMACWLVAVVSMLLLKWQRIDLNDFVLLAAPMSFYISKALDFNLTYRFRFFLFLLMFAVPVYQFWFYYTHDLEQLSKEQLSPLTTGNNYAILNESKPIRNYLEDNPLEEGIWIMDYQPSLYNWLDAYCASKYLDYRIAFYKIPVLSNIKEPLFTALEGDREIFLQFKDNPPELILDPRDQFPRLLNRYPLLSRAYERINLNSYPIYRRKNLSLSHEIRRNNIPRQ